MVTSLPARFLLSCRGFTANMAARKDSIGELTELMGSLLHEVGGSSGTTTGSAPAPAAPTSTSVREKPSGDVIQEAVFKPLRPYQQQILEVVRGLLEKQPSRALLYLPTGGGKTRIAGETAKWALSKGWRVAFVVNRVALVDQSARAFQEIGIPATSIGYIASGRAGNTAAPLQIATMQTLAKRYALLGDRSSTGSTASAAADEPAAADEGDGGRATVDCDAAAASDAAAAAASDGGKASSVQFDLLLLDEAHAATSRSYQALLQRCGRAAPAPAAASESVDGGGDPAMKPHVLGLTATPVRLRADEQLSRVFGTLIKGPSISDLIASGVLATPMVVDARDEALAAADKKKVSTDAPTRKSAGSDKSGDSTSRSKAGTTSSGTPTAAAVSGSDDGSEVPDACAALVREWQRRCSVGTSSSDSAAYRKTIVFAADVAHSHALTAAFREVTGVAAAHIDGETTASTREGIFGALKRGDVTVVCSVGVLSEGFDEPSVSCVVLCRPTHSKALYIQQVGRGLRSYPGKRDCIVLDAVGNTLTHGPITGPLGCEYEWDGEDADAPRSDGALRAAAKPMKASSSSTRKDAAVISIRYSTADAAAPAAAAAPSHAARRDASSSSSSVAWVCPAQACRTIVHARVRACPQCGTVKALSTRTATDYAGSGSSTSSSGAGVAGLVGKMAGMAISGAADSGAAKSSATLSARTKALGSLANAVGGGPLAPATLVPIPRKQPAAAPAAASAAASAAGGSGVPAAPAAPALAIPRKAAAATPAPEESTTAKPSGLVPTTAIAAGAHAAAAPSIIAGASASSASAAPPAPPAAVSAVTTSTAIPKKLLDATAVVVTTSAAAGSAVAPAGGAHAIGGAPLSSAAVSGQLVWREAVDGPLFSHPAFAAACARHSLPQFSPAAGRNDWERDFLASVARQITPGAHHDRKRDPAESRFLSDKQEATLRDILARASGSRGTGKAAAGGAAPGGR